MRKTSAASNARALAAAGYRQGARVCTVGRAALYGLLRGGGTEVREQVWQCSSGSDRMQHGGACAERTGKLIRAGLAPTRSRGSDPVEPTIETSVRRNVGE